MNDTGNPTQDGQTDVDQKISTTSSLKENTQRRQDDRKQDLANVTVEWEKQLAPSSPSVHFFSEVRSSGASAPMTVDQQERNKGDAYEAVKGILI